MHAGQEQQLRSVDVAEPGGHALIEQHLAQRPITQGLHARHDRSGVEIGRQQIGTESGQGRRAPQVGGAQELGVGHIERHGHARGRLDDDAHRTASALPTLTGLVEMPRPVHAHVGAQHQTAGEGQQQMFPAG